MAEELKEWANMWGAKVKLPCDMPVDPLTFFPSFFHLLSLPSSFTAQDNMLKDAIETCRRVIQVSDFDAKGLEFAEKIKFEFDERWSPHWHVIIGRNFGSFVTHETNHFVYFYLGDKAIMMFKAG